MNRKFNALIILTMIVVSIAWMPVDSPNQISIKEKEDSIESKIDPLLLEMIVASPTGNSSVSVIIIIIPRYSLPEVQILKNLDIKHRFDTINAVVAQVALNNIFNIAKAQEIESVWLDRPERAIPSSSIQSEIQNLLRSSYSNQNIVNFTDEIGAIDLWKKGINGSSSVIAILDSGIDLTGQIGGDLDDFDENPNTFDAKFVGAVSLVPEEPLYYTDFTGRGTFHAGIACGTGFYNNSYKGVAPGAHYLNVKVYDSFGLTYWSFLISGIEWSIQHSADIILFCTDIPGIYFDPVSMAINAATDKGIVVIVPTGDDGPSYMSVTTPGQALGAISVGAYDMHTNLVANFSGRGPGLDFRIVPDLVAPGVDLISCRAKILTNSSLQLLNDLSSLLNFAGIGLEIDTEILDDLPNGLFPSPHYGDPINDHYTKSSGTGAAAAIVAGCVALLMEAFPLANPQLIRNALCDTSEPILGDFNTEGCGVVNVSAAYNYLYRYFGENSFTKIPYSAPLLYTGFVSTSDTDNWTQSLNSTEINATNAYNLNAIVSTQLLFDAIVVSNESDFTQIHLPINQFGFEYDGRVHWLSEFTVLREFHQISSRNIGEEDYNRYLGVLELDGLIVTTIIESWNYVSDNGTIPQIHDRVNGYKISLKILNLRQDRNFTDFNLISYFRSDLFVNETGLVTMNNSEGIKSILNIGLDDTLAYDFSTQTMQVWDQSNNTEFAFPYEYAVLGYNATSHQVDSYVIAESLSLFADLTVNGTANNRLDNSSIYQIGKDDPGFALQYNLSKTFSYEQMLNFSSILSIGIGDSLSSANHSLHEQMAYLKSDVSFYPIQDIIIAKVQDFSRMAAKDEIYSSKALVLNVGNTIINNSRIIFGANRTTSEGYIEVYSKISSIENFELHDYYYITQHWTPLEEGVYLTGWIAIIPVLSGPNAEDNLLNNYLIRNVYIYSKPFYVSILRDTFQAYPTRLDLSPMKVHYPGDLGLFNITTYGVLEIPDVTVEIDATGKRFMQIMWFGPDIISQLFNQTSEVTPEFHNFSSSIYTKVMNTYDTVFCLIIAPLFCPPTVIEFNLSFSSPMMGGKFFSINVQLSFEEFQGRIFFDGIHNFLSMESDLSALRGDIMNVDLRYIIDLEERLDYPYANYFEFQNMWGTTEPKGATIQTFFPGITIKLSDYVSGLDSIVGGELDSSESGSFLGISFMQNLLGGYNFEKDTLSTNTIHHDLLQFFDVLIINDPEIEIIEDEISDIIEWVELGGTLIVWAENSTENQIDSLNNLVQYANLSISPNSEVMGKTSITSATWNSSETLFPQIDIGSIFLDSPVKMSINRSEKGIAKNVEVLCEEGYFAAAQIGKGNVFVSGDKDLFSIEGLLMGNNSEFSAALMDYALKHKFLITITPSANPINLYDITYFHAEITNYEELSDFLETGILFLSAFMYENSSVVNITFFGFTLPAFVVMATNISHYSMYYDSSWYTFAGEYYALFIVDHPAIAQEIIYVPFVVESGEPPPSVKPYIFPEADYPFWVDMLAIIWLIAMGLLIWFYQNEKWKTRLNIIQLKGDLLNQAKTKINEGKSLIRQILQGLEITEDEQEQIRIILRSRRRVRKYMRELKQFGEKIGEHYD